MMQTTLAHNFEIKPTLWLDVLPSTGQIILETACHAQQYDALGHKDCPHCGGKKTIPTQDGQRLLAFLQRHDLRRHDGS